jgi:hypothetical protein
MSAIGRFLRVTLGHFLFTKILLPALLAAANSSPGVGGRVVNTSSLGHHLQNLDFSTFRDGPSRKKMGTWNLYYQSKYVRRDICFYVTIPKTPIILLRVTWCSLSSWHDATAIKELYLLRCILV